MTEIEREKYMQVCVDVGPTKTSGIVGIVFDGDAAAGRLNGRRAGQVVVGVVYSVDGLNRMHDCLIVAVMILIRTRRSEKFIVRRYNDRLLTHRGRGRGLDRLFRRMFALLLHFACVSIRVRFD